MEPTAPPPVPTLPAALAVMVDMELELSVLFIGCFPLPSAFVAVDDNVAMSFPSGAAAAAAVFGMPKKNLPIKSEASSVKNLEGESGLLLLLDDSPPLALFAVVLSSSVPTANGGALLVVFIPKDPIPIMAPKSGGLFVVVVLLIPSMVGCG